MIWQRRSSLQHRPSEYSEHSRCNRKARKPAFREDPIFWDFRTLCKQNCKYNEDGNRAYVNQNLGESSKLRIETKEEERESKECDRQRQCSMDQVL